MRAPGLRADDRGQREADQAAANDETCQKRERRYVDRLLVVLLPRVCAGIFTGSVGGEHHPDDAGSADRHEPKHALAGAAFVHHGAHD